MCQRIIALIISVIVTCTCIPDLKVYAGWPYLTKTQFIEDDWQLKTGSGKVSSYTFTLKHGTIGIKSTVWGHYQFIDGWTLRFKRKDMGGIIVTIERVGSDKMIWWITDLNGKKVRDTPLFTWVRQ